MDWIESSSAVGLSQGAKESSACSSFLLRAEGHRCVRVGCACAPVEACVGCAAPAGAAAAGAAGSEV